jgi:hypothetical protein
MAADPTRCRFKDNEAPLGFRPCACKANIGLRAEAQTGFEWGQDRSDLPGWLTYHSPTRKCS